MFVRAGGDPPAGWRKTNRLAAREEYKKKRNLRDVKSRLHTYACRPIRNIAESAPAYYIDIYRRGRPRNLAGDKIGIRITAILNLA